MSFTFHNTNEPAVADVLQVFLFGPELPSFVAYIQFRSKTLLLLCCGVILVKHQKSTDSHTLCVHCCIPDTFFLTNHHPKSYIGEL